MLLYDATNLVIFKKPLYITLDIVKVTKDDDFNEKINEMINS